MKNSIVKDAMRLFVITLISGIVLGFFYDLTKEPIAAQEEKTQMEAYQAVLPDADTYEEASDSSYAADIESTMQPLLDEAGYTSDSITGLVIASKSGTYAGVVLTVTAHDGYGGDIEFSVGILPDGTINGISILSISETAGLGMRAKTDPTFLSQWVGTNQESYELVKSGGDPASGTVDAISGSTITSAAFQRGINAALVAFRSLQENSVSTAGGVTIG
jgi:electron transport complex protein RnfG